MAIFPSEREPCLVNYIFVLLMTTSAAPARRSDSKDSKDDGRAAGAWHAVLSTFLYDGISIQRTRREIRSLRPPPFCFGQYLAKMKKKKKSQKFMTVREC